MSQKRMRVAIVGLGFGAEFIPIYQAHPNAEMYAICRRNKAELDTCGDQFGIAKRYTELRRRCSRTRTSTPSTSTARSPTTRRRRIAALKAGKHVACTVPMAHQQRARCRQIVELQRKIGKVYMMMETVVYAASTCSRRTCTTAASSGRIQFLRGSHQQDMDGWPDYWPGLPPMWYATHCVSPCLAILSDAGEGPGARPRASSATARAASARSCITKYNSPFAVETATFKIKGTRRRAPR